MRFIAIICLCLISTGEVTPAAVSARVKKMETLPGANDPLEGPLLYEADESLRQEALRMYFATQLMESELKGVSRQLRSEYLARVEDVRSDRHVASLFLSPLLIPGGFLLLGLAELLSGNIGEVTGACVRAVSKIPPKIAIALVGVGVASVGTGALLHSRVSNREESGYYEKKHQPTKLSGTVPGKVQSAVSDVAFVMNWNNNSRAVEKDRFAKLAQVVHGEVIALSERDPNSIPRDRLDLLELMKKNDMLYQFEDPITFQRTRKVANAAKKFSDAVGLSEPVPPKKTDLQKRIALFEEFLTETEKRILSSNAELLVPREQAINVVYSTRNRLSQLKSRYGL